MNANEQVYEVPLVELLERVPKDARFWVEEKHSSTHYPVGRLSHEAAEMLRQQQAELDAFKLQYYNTGYSIQLRDKDETIRQQQAEIEALKAVLEQEGIGVGRDLLNGGIALFRKAQEND